MPTPHNAALKGQIADCVLMPGDPARAKMIADTYLEKVETVSQVRGNGCYTGYYKGHRISVMASGMGMPSLGIYSYELYKEYDVKRIIRVGTAGSYVKELGLMDVFLADSAYSESSFALTQSGYTGNITYPSAAFNEDIKKTAEEQHLPLHIGRLHSSDVFYREGDGSYMDEIVNKYGCQCVEMESFALFHNAAVCGKEAACLITISDSFVAPGILSPEERQNSLHTMIRLALESCTRQ